jgi:hypothetical protein
MAQGGSNVMTSRKKPGVAFWATVAVFVVLAYPLSFGPACWTMSRVGPRRLPRFYRLVARFTSRRDMIGKAFLWYANLGSRSDGAWDHIRGEIIWWWFPPGPEFHLTRRSSSPPEEDAMEAESDDDEGERP